MEKNRLIVDTSHVVIRQTPDAAYWRLLEEDVAHRDAAADALSGPLDVYDEIMVFVLELIQLNYMRKAEWEDDPQRRVVAALITEGFNGLLLARHVVLLGYYTESWLLIRRVQEAVARAFLFHEDRLAADRFLNGDELKDSWVRKRLEKVFCKKGHQEAGETVAADLWQSYTRRSKYGHMNLEALVWRSPPLDAEDAASTDPSALARRVGRNPIIGGLLTLHAGFAAFMELNKLAEMLVQSAVAQIPGLDEARRARHGQLRAKIAAEGQRTRERVGLAKDT